MNDDIVFQPLYLSVAGYKSIYAKQRVKIAPLTILAGTNSSGKSSFMQPFLLIKQTLEAPFEPETLLLDGSHVSMTDNKQMFSKIGHQIADSFAVKIESQLKSHEIVFSNTEDKNIGIKNVFDDSSMLIADIENAQIKVLANEETPITLTGNTQGIVLTFMHNNERLKIYNPLTSFLENFIHLPGLRGNPQRSYKRTGVTKFFQGTFEPYTSTIINHWLTTPSEHRKLIELNQDLKTLGLTQSVQVQKLNDAYLELYVSRTPTSEDMVNIADVGLGVSQTLPILVALIVAEPEQVVYIEQPELHLHPKAQHILAGIIAKASKRGVRVILETHSSLLLLAVQTMVAEGDLDAQLVALHWFTRDLNSGETHVDSAELDENGAFGDWPEDFDDTFLKAEKAYLDAVESKVLYGSCLNAVTR